MFIKLNFEVLKSYTTEPNIKNVNRHKTSKSTDTTPICNDPIDMDVNYTKNTTEISTQNTQQQQEEKLEKIIDIQKTKEIKQKIEKTTQNQISIKTVTQLIEKKGLDVVVKYIDNYHRFKTNKHNPVGFLIKAILNDYVIPKEEINDYKGKPIQSTNFEQRVYDDDYFESLYENFKY